MTQSSYLVVLGVGIIVTRKPKPLLKYHLAFDKFNKVKWAFLWGTGVNEGEGEGTESSKNKQTNKPPPTKKKHSHEFPWLVRKPQTQFWVCTLSCVLRTGMSESMGSSCWQCVYWVWKGTPIAGRLVFHWFQHLKEDPTPGRKRLLRVCGLSSWGIYSRSGPTERTVPAVSCRARFGRAGRASGMPNSGWPVDLSQQLWF